MAPKLTEAQAPTPPGQAGRVEPEAQGRAAELSQKLRKEVQTIKDGDVDKEEDEGEDQEENEVVEKNEDQVEDDDGGEE